MRVNDGGGREDESPRIGVGDANANIVPPDFVTFHNFKHQNTQFEAKKSFPGRGLSPGGSGIPFPTSPLAPTKTSESIPASRRIPARFTHMNLGHTFAGHRSINVDRYR